MTEIDELRADLELERANLLEAWRVWAQAQGQHLHDELMNEGRITATRQAAVTEALGADGVNTLKAKLAELASTHGARLDAWGKALNAPGDDAAAVWGEALHSARVEFGHLFTSAGFRGAGGSRDWGGPDAWEFYYPATGTARGRFIPPRGSANEELREAERAVDRANRLLGAAVAAAQAETARGLWGE